MRFNVKALVITTVYSLTSVIVSLMIAWQVMVKLDFSYGIWHDYGGMKVAIELYGPRNSYKHGFGDTTRDERIRVFSEIVKSITNSGEGLAKISYHVAPSQQETLLLRAPEVRHLQHVANLVDFCMALGLFFSFIWLVLCSYLVWCQAELPAMKKQMFSLIGFTGIATLVVLIIGPVTLFSYLHGVIFPAEDQWFFYYKDSLMSTMMWAPRLFGWIALEWIFFTLIIFAFQQYLVLCMLNKRLAKK